MVALESRFGWYKVITVSGKWMSEKGTAALEELAEDLKKKKAHQSLYDL